MGLQCQTTSKEYGTVIVLIVAGIFRMALFKEPWVCVLLVRWGIVCLFDFGFWCVWGFFG